MLTGAGFISTSAQRRPRRRSPTTAAWRGRWVTVTARSLRWSRRTGRRRPGRPFAYGEPDAWAVESSQLVGLAFIRHDWTRLNALAAARGQALTPPEFAWQERS